MNGGGLPSESVGHDERPPSPSAAAETGMEERNWADALPLNVLSMIYQMIGSIDIMKGAQSVCQRWWKLALEPETWRRVDMTGHSHLSREIDMVEMAKLAIDRSDGRLEEFYTESVGNDELMEYIAERSVNLKCLGLKSCSEISGRALVDVAERSPKLEELETSLCDQIPEEVYAAIGKACGQLKHLRLNRQRYLSYNYESDVEALAIANDMRGLRHLELVGNKLTNSGLHAILDNCARLEYLDIRACYNVKMDAALQSKCARIRDFKFIDYGHRDDFGHYKTGDIYWYYD